MSFEERITLVTISFRSKSSLEKLIKNVSDDYEIIIVDNSQDFETTKEFSNKPHLKILSPKHNLGFGAACNLGAKASSRDYLFFVNPDCILKEKTIENLYQASQKYKNASAFSPKILALINCLVDPPRCESNNLKIGVVLSPTEILPRLLS